MSMYSADIASMNSVDRFRGMAEQEGGSYTVRTDGSIGKARCAIWLKSLFNIGNARERNAQVLTVLKDELVKDGRYGALGEQLDEMLNRLDGKYPVSAKKITQLLADLDQMTMAKHYELAYVCVIKTVTPEGLKGLIAEAFTRANVNPARVTPAYEASIRRNILGMFEKMGGDLTTPLDETAFTDAVKEMVKRVAGHFAKIEATSLSDFDKNILRDAVFLPTDGGAPVMDDNEMERWITIRHCMVQLAEMKKLYSSTARDGILCRALEDAVREIGPAGKQISDSALSGWAARVRDVFSGAVNLGDTMLSDEAARKLFEGVVLEFKDSLAVCARLQDPAERNSMENIFLQTEHPMSPVYMNALLAVAREIDGGEIIRGVRGASDPVELYAFLNRLKPMLGKGYGEFVEIFNVDGVFGHLHYMDCILSLALGKTESSDQEIVELHDKLLSQPVRELQSFLGFMTRFDIEEASLNATLMALYGALAREMGLPLRQILQNSDNFPRVSGVRELPFSTLDLLPEDFDENKVLLKKY